MPPLDGLLRRLGYAFNDPVLLTEALTHRSAGSRHNERLEFLGDAILNFIVAEQLFGRFSRATEGELSRLRASLVKKETLAILAQDLDLGEYLNLGPGELKSGGWRRESILADTLEALIGAIYLDGGIEPARRFILTILDERLEAASPKKELKDPKTRLQEYLQSRRLALPNYTVLSIEGAAHAQIFRIECRAEAIGLVAEAVGASRRKAEQAAAENVLRMLSHD